MIAHLPGFGSGSIRAELASIRLLDIGPSEEAGACLFRIPNHGIPKKGDLITSVYPGTGMQ